MKELQYPVRPGRYRHFKGNEYQVLGVARHSETEEEMVVYRALYGEGGLWVRPAAMWNEIVERDGKLIWRCPNCGNTDQDKMNVARRTCGYIGTQFWNQGRTQEIKERVLHL